MQKNTIISGFMKKKFLSFLSLFFVIISCIILFSACGAPSETGFKIILNGKEVNSQTIELSYGEGIDLELFSTFNDNTTKEVPESKFTLTDPNNIIGLTPSVGTYELKVKYANYDEVDISIIVVPKEIDILESKLGEVLDLVDGNDTAQLTKKVGGMDRQIAKLNKSIEKIASHVVEK